MVREKRRAERINIRLPVSVLLWDEKTDTRLAGPEKGEARNFSPMGVAVSLDTVRVGNFHIFFTCQDNLSHILKIGFHLPDDQGVIEIPARPVWYDRDPDAKGKRALLGVEFLLKPKDKNLKRLARELSADSSPKIRWWDKILK